MELPGDGSINMVNPERRGLAVARQLEELAKVVKDEDEKVDMWIFGLVYSIGFRGVLQLTGTILRS